MQPLRPADVAESFVNATRGEVKALHLPAGFDRTSWDDLDFLGWRDPRAPERAYLVAPHGGRLVGVLLRRASAESRAGSALCNLCHSAQQADDVSLFTAKRAGAAGRDGNSVGTYVCADLACSLYVRGLRELRLPQGETVPTEVRVERLQSRVGAFLDRVLA